VIFLGASGRYLVPLLLSRITTLKRVRVEEWVKEKYT
jgi:hypothetical protein